MPARNIKSIYKALKPLGLDKKFINELLLPDWWTEEVLHTEIGYIQTLSIISKNLGVNLKDLLKDDIKINLRDSHTIKFKTSRNIQLEKNTFWIQSLSSRIIEILDISYNCSEKKFKFINDINELRDFLIEKYKIINLENILNYLWNTGIPVIYISEFPKELYKMDGMVINTEKMPIITISKNRKHDAWLLFVILHELGHYIKNHLNADNNIVFDDDLLFNVNDKEEEEANEVALYLITGYKKPNLIQQRIDSAFRLVSLCRSLSTELNSDPGTIALNYAFHFNNYAIAEQTLNILEPNNNAISKIKNNMIEYLDLNLLSDENREYLINISDLSTLK